jgi:hypothetical protein
MGRRWLAVVAAALVSGVYAAQVVVPAAETSPAPIAGIAPSYGPKTVSTVPNAAAIMRRMWSPDLDAGYDPQGLAVDGGGIYVSAYRSDSLSVHRGPCRVIRIDLETGGASGYVVEHAVTADGEAASMAARARRCGAPVSGSSRSSVPQLQSLRAIHSPPPPIAIPAVSARARGYWRARRVDARWDLARHLRKWSQPALPLHGGDPGPAVRRRDARGVPGRHGADYPRP